MNLQGCGTALIPPFKQDQSIDEQALRSLVEWQITSGIHFLVPCGTTGETPTLTKDEWLRVIDITIEVNGGRVPIVAGATSNCTAEAVEKARELNRRKGVDAILTASPYYNKPTQEGQYQHFKAIAEAVDKPLVLYSVVGRTAANIEPATLGRLAKIPNIIAVKEASGNISQIAEVFRKSRRENPDRMRFFMRCSMGRQREQQRPEGNVIRAGRRAQAACCGRRAVPWNVVAV